MRNVTPAAKQILMTAMIAMAMGVAGCQVPTAGGLDQARAALAANKFEDAGAAIDTFLANDTSGTQSAEAYYIKGRSIELSPNKSQEDARTHLQQARFAYLNALKAGTSDTNLEGMIRAAIANVAYWQDDYTTAAEQWTAAYEMLNDPNTKARALLRTGISQQRLGRFETADLTFAQTMQRFPNTDPAARAQAHRGARAFNVQLAFSQPAQASTAQSQLTKSGLPVQRSTSSDGKPLVLVGPYSTYAQANAAKAKVATQYSMAMIVP